jgi:hypothetical protein
LVRYLTLSWGMVFRLEVFRKVGGKYAKRYYAGASFVLLASHVRRAFRIERSVKDVLRLVIESRKM